ncbi:hypothetical protein PENSPDRAFT_758099 [Peniophora sp. CONT]|nr:hypothetical protein PENSPDRAFT_758099 [Peniophora sp. CONT]
MTEDAHTLRLLLRFIYPRSAFPEPEISTLEDIKRTAALARKYDVPFMREAAEKALVAFADSQPEIAYVMAWKYEYPSALRAAARRYLEPHICSPDDSVFDDVPATALKRLHNYCDAVPAALEGMLLADLEEHAITWTIRNSIWCKERVVPPLTIERQNHSCEILSLWYTGKTGAVGGPKLHAVSSWWYTYIQAVVQLVQSPGRPSLDDAFDRPIPDARKQIAGCNSCRLRVEHGLLDFTKGQLRAEIERRLSEIHVDAPFMRKDD